MLAVGAPLAPESTKRTLDLIEVSALLLRQRDDGDIQGCRAGLG